MSGIAGRRWSICVLLKAPWEESTKPDFGLLLSVEFLRLMGLIVTVILHVVVTSVHVPHRIPVLTHLLITESRVGP